MYDISEFSGVPVSRETTDQLLAFCELVQKWSARINLVSGSTIPEIWQRHVLDSAQLVSLIEPSVNHYVDLGSGGGFPGVVVAAILRDHDRVDRITLVESDTRKSVFLRQAARHLNLSFEVATDRIERLRPLGADLITARALAPLPNLLDFISRHLKPDGMALFPKGRSAHKEISLLPPTIQYAIRCHASQTDPEAQILELRGL